MALWLRKIPDILCMAVLHLLVHVTYGRDNAKTKTKTKTETESETTQNKHMDGNC